MDHKLVVNYVGGTYYFTKGPYKIIFKKNDKEMCDESSTIDIIRSTSEDGSPKHKNVPFILYMCTSAGCQDAAVTSILVIIIYDIL